MNNLKFDKDHIWHPYTSTINPLRTYMVKSAKGVYIELENGEQLIDGMSSWWAVIHGYNHPIINDAIEEQVRKMSHIMFGGFTHLPVLDLTRKLIAITDRSFDKIFYSDSGSVAIEVAMKMALQYWASLKKYRKNRFLALRGGYHGDTWNAMSVCDPEIGMHHIFSRVLPQQLFVDRPKIRFNQKWDEDDILPMTRLIKENHNSIAAVILEPIVQGAGGMWFYSPVYLKRVKQLCEKYNILLIFDEIATGFGRTGKLFAYQYAGVIPDILCLGKALTGGYLGMAATLTSSQIADTISNGEAGVLMHGPTFMANPLACAVANASIDLLLKGSWNSDVKRIEQQMKEELAEVRSLSNVKDLRILGAIGVVEMKNNINVEMMQAIFVKKGIWIRPFMNLVYIMPPYIISSLELTKLTSVIRQVLKTLS